MTTRLLLDNLNEDLISFTTNRGRSSQRLLLRIQDQCSKLHERVADGQAKTVRRTSKIWAAPKPAHYGRSDYSQLPDQTPRRLFRSSYAGRGTTLFYAK